MYLSKPSYRSDEEEEEEEEETKTIASWSASVLFFSLAKGQGKHSLL